MNDSIWQQHALSNRLQAVWLLCLMCGFLALIGWLLWGLAGSVLTLVLGVVLVAINPVASPALVMRLYRAQPVDPRALPNVAYALQVLSRRAKLPRIPTLYYIPSQSLNAFAVGVSGRAAIGVTDGILRGLSYRQLVAVLAHEMSHIRSNDMWLLGLADLFSRLTAALSLVGQLMLLISLPFVLFYGWEVSWIAIALLILAPNLSALVQLALSRNREYDADLSAVQLTGDPEGLIEALTRIERTEGRFWERILMPRRRSYEPSLLRTHPPTEDRIARLRELSASAEEDSWIRELDQHRNLDELFGRPSQRRPRWHITGLWR